MRLLVRFTLAVPALLGALSVAARAGVIYSNLDPGGGFATGSGETVSVPIDLRPSFEFSPSSNEFLTEVDFVASMNSDTDTGQWVTVTLSSDNGGQPGTVLATSPQFTNLGVLGISSALLSWMPATAPALTGGASYWITLDGPFSNGDVTWNDNDTFQSGYSIFNGTSWVATSNTMGALQIQGSPEPGTLVLLGSALIGLGVFARRRSGK